MLLVTAGVIIPTALANHISVWRAILLSLIMWGCSMVTVFVCIRSRRSRERNVTTYTDYSDTMADQDQHSGR